MRELRWSIVRLVGVAVSGGNRTEYLYLNAHPPGTRRTSFPPLSSPPSPSPPSFPAVASMKSLGTTLAGERFQLHTALVDMPGAYDAVVTKSL